MAHANKDDYKAADRRFRRGHPARSRDADAYLSRGAMHEELGNAAAARADYAKALEILPEHEDARESLARLGN